jgi:hypothetical protein
MSEETEERASKTIEIQTDTFWIKSRLLTLGNEHHPQPLPVLNPLKTSG